MPDYAAPICLLALFGISYLIMRIPFDKAIPGTLRLPLMVDKVGAVVMGLIAGGPTFIGTAIGQAWVSEALSVVFLALAAGSILYVVIELLNVLCGAGSKAIVTWGILLGLTLGFGTDFVLVATGV